ncbi:hypothetical protein JCM10296v2_007548 [Rhodotorula toruloides]
MAYATRFSAIRAAASSDAASYTSLAPTFKLLPDPPKPSRDSLGRFNDVEEQYLTKRDPQHAAAVLRTVSAPPEVIFAPTPDAFFRHYHRDRLKAHLPPLA